MAKGKKAALNYSAEIKLLRSEGPGRLYLLYGEEAYLREQFLKELRALCVPEESAFSAHRLNGAGLDLAELGEAVNAMPFFSERSYVEVRDYALSRCRDAEWERMKAIVSDIPEWCTLAFVQSPENTPDARLSCVKSLKKLGRAIEFTEQEPRTLISWITRRYTSYGKTISPADAEYLLFLAGRNMTRLIPEIEKSAAYAKGDAVTRPDLDATVTRIPEAVVWDMIDDMGARRFDRAAACLSDLLGDKDNHPILLTALIGQQYRRMYAVKVGQEAGRGRSEQMELCGVTYGSAFNKLSDAVRARSREELAGQVRLCAEYDYRMKSTGVDPYVLIRELFGRLAASA